MTDHSTYDAVRQTKDCLHCKGSGKSDDDNPCGFCDDEFYEVVIVGGTPHRVCSDCKVIAEDGLCDDCAADRYEAYVEQRLNNQPF